MNGLRALEAGCLVVAAMPYATVQPTGRVLQAAVRHLRGPGDAALEAESEFRDHHVTGDD